MSDLARRLAALELAAYAGGRDEAECERIADRILAALSAIVESDGLTRDPAPDRAEIIGRVRRARGLEPHIE